MKKIYEAPEVEIKRFTLLDAIADPSLGGIDDPPPEESPVDPPVESGPPSDPKDGDL